MRTDNKYKCFISKDLLQLNIIPIFTISFSKVQKARKKIATSDTADLLLSTKSFHTIL
jgi:hypothetical protein